MNFLLAWGKRGVSYKNLRRFLRNLLKVEIDRGNLNLGIVFDRVNPRHFGGGDFKGGTSQCTS